PNPLRARSQEGYPRRGPDLGGGPALLDRHFPDGAPSRGERQPAELSPLYQCRRPSNRRLLAFSSRREKKGLQVVAGPVKPARSAERNDPTMEKLRVVNFTVSIDGYSAGPNQDLQNPLGANDPG